eukprot:scaffold269680_cov28-Tisochrysis_lutea.AAC.1
MPQAVRRKRAMLPRRARGHRARRASAARLRPRERAPTVGRCIQHAAQLPTSATSPLMSLSAILVEEIPYHAGGRSPRHAGQVGSGLSAARRTPPERACNRDNASTLRFACAASDQLAWQHLPSAAGPRDAASPSRAKVALRACWAYSGECSKSRRKAVAALSCISSAAAEASVGSSSCTSGSSSSSSSTQRSMPAGREMRIHSRRTAASRAAATAGANGPAGCLSTALCRKSAATQHACSTHMRSRSEPLCEASPKAPSSCMAAKASSHPCSVWASWFRCPDQSVASHRLKSSSCAKLRQDAAEDLAHGRMQVHECFCMGLRCPQWHVGARKLCQKLEHGAAEALQQLRQHIEKVTRKKQGDWQAWCEARHHVQAQLDKLSAWGATRRLWA